MKTRYYDDSGREYCREYPETINQEITMDIKNMRNMSTAELVAFYNKATGKNIKKFSSRAAGEQQVANLQKAAPEAKPTKAKPKAGSKPKAEGGGMSASIAASWQDKAVALARSTKNKVKVGGEEYRSVAAAFEALKLPMSKHIPFRAKLKAHGRAAFEGHTFTIVGKE